MTALAAGTIAMTAAEAGKRAAAHAAAALVEDGMLVGLGTGTTVAWLIEALGERVARGLRIRAVASSRRSEAAARALAIPVEPFDALSAVDLVVDGVDEVDPALRAIKGGGGALLREKVLAEAAARMVAIADAAKPVARLGGTPVPLEIIGFAHGFVAARVAALGGEARPRAGALTDQGNPLLDCAFGTIDDPERLAAALQAIPGVVAHGLFLDQIDALCIGGDGAVEWRHRAA